MEYTFKNSVSEKSQTIVLHQSHMIVQSAGQEKRIPYAAIHTVRLSRASDKVFRLTLFPENHAPITVANKYCMPDGAIEDRSRQYTAFVRVLHYHLREKGAPRYSSGFSLNLLVVWILISSFASFFISFVSEYLELTVMNPFLQAIVLTTILLSIIIGFNYGRLPKTYSPTEIPFQFLP